MVHTRDFEKYMDRNLDFAHKNFHGIISFIQSFSIIPKNFTKTTITKKQPCNAILTIKLKKGRLGNSMQLESRMENQPHNWVHKMWKKVLKSAQCSVPKISNVSTAILENSFLRSWTWDSVRIWQTIGLITVEKSFAKSRNIVCEKWKRI